MRSMYSYKYNDTIYEYDKMYTVLVVRIHVPDCRYIIY